MIDYNILIQWVFFGVIGFSFMSAVKILSLLKNSIDELNIKMATIITTITYHEKSIEILKQEIEYLRNRKSKEF